MICLASCCFPRKKINAAKWDYWPANCHIQSAGISKQTISLQPFVTMWKSVLSGCKNRYLSLKRYNFVWGVFCLNGWECFEQQLSLIWKTGWLILTTNIVRGSVNICFSWHFVAHNSTKEQDALCMTCERQISNRKQTPGNAGEINKEKQNSHFSDNDVPRKFFHAFAAEQQKGGKNWKEEESSTNKWEKQSKVILMKTIQRRCSQ